MNRPTKEVLSNFKTVLDDCPSEVGLLDFGGYCENENHAKYKKCRECWEQAIAECEATNEN